MDFSFEFREVRSTKVIHIFDVVDGVRAIKPICGIVVGALTFPLDAFDNVEDEHICKSCLGRKSRL
jgi:hypothetical protein